MRSRPGDAAVAVAAAFGLGTVTGEWLPVPGGRSHRLWKVTTTTGMWAVKQLNRSREPWWWEAYTVAADIEAAAFRAGIAMPRPVHPLRPAHSDAPPLADVVLDGSTVSFLVHGWCAGHALTSLDDCPELPEWVGDTLAALHALPVHRPTDAVVPPHRVEEWTEWLGDAPDRDGFVPAVRAFLPDIARAIDVVDDALRRATLSPVLTHGDLKPDNVLLTPTGPLLVDWDAAGSDLAEWEVTRTALAFAAHSRGGWDPGTFVRVVRSYEASGGRVVPPVATSLVGVLHHGLSAAAWLLWRALGHRPVTAAERAAAHGQTIEFLTGLRTSLDRIEDWARLLRPPR